MKSLEHRRTVKFEVVKLTAAHRGWYVRATLPHGEKIFANHFKTEAAAQDWIAAGAGVWLNRYRGGRYA